MIFLSIFLIPTFFGLLSCQSSQNTPNPDPVVLEYNGELIRLSELDLKTQKKSFPLQRELYTTLQSGSRTYVINRFLKEYAEKHKTTVSEARKQLAPPKTVNEKEKRKFFEKVKNDIPYTYAQISNELESMIQKDNGNRTEDTLLNLALWQKNANLIYPKPIPARVEIDTKGYPSKGPANAKLKIVEFGDFTCPYCKKLAPLLSKIQSEYKNQIRIEWLYFTAHPGKIADQLAIAGYCAHKINRFWDYHDYVFKNQMKVLWKKADELYKDLKIPISKTTETCLKSPLAVKHIRKSQKLGRQLSLKGTPGLFFNGRQEFVQFDYKSLKTLALKYLSE